MRGIGGEVRDKMKERVFYDIIKNMKKTFFLAIILVGVLVLAGAGCGKGGGSPSNKNLIFFWGDGCSHCAKVEEYFTQNKVKEKIDFDSLEIYKNKKNAELMAQKAKVCDIPLSNMGVPFLWNDGKCLVGDVDIIAFFEEKLKTPAN